jgi:predicted CopG family antitoxin
MVMEKESVTIRFPSELMRQAKRLKSGKESFNELVVEAVEREVRRRKALETHETIQRLLEQDKRRTGVHRDPLPSLRQLREGEWELE